jgi:flagellar basal body P-ring formation protein FlgA
MTNYERQVTAQSILYMFRLAFRVMAISLVVTYGLLFIFLNMKQAEAATLKPEAIIQGSVVNISDLFEGIPLKQDAVVGNAPSPGHSVILTAKTLQRMADIYNIKWTASSPSEQILVRSLVQKIGTEDLVAVLKKDLEERGVSGNFTVTLNNVAPQIILPANIESTVEVVQMSYTPGRDVFNAVMAAPSAANPVKTINISGLIEKTVQIPVLKESISSGDIIGSSDIEWIDVAARHMLRDTVIDADSLIGKTPLRMVEQGIPVRARDIVSPQLVARGDEIVLQFNQGGLELTVKGKALQNGAEGEFIRVVNLSSNQTLRGEVTGSKMVAVQ